MNSYNRFLSVLILSLLIPFSARLAAADDPNSASDDETVATQPSDAPAPPASDDAATESTADAPARAARLQYMTGSVSVQPQGTGDWTTGQLNRPLTNSDNIWADKDSRAEISVGTGVIRIGSESSLTLTNISENMVQLQLHQGEMNLHVRRLYDGETYEVDTPNQAFTVEKPGDYRFDVDSNADTTVITVWRGEGESSGNGPTVRIRENQQARFNNSNSMTADIHQAPSPDSFDEWARSRDEHFDQSASARHVSPDVVGYEDLDEYGTWKETPDYGDVWVPRDVPVGWAPYTYGHWIWENPWGWTWVDYDPWGYAPFHYGRWVYWSGYWGWAPGPIWVRPYYAPALVAWFGGPGWGVSVGFGGGFGYGWCPLGWGEPFIPWYHSSFGYFRGVNYSNTHFTNINITNIYNNNFIHNRPGWGGRPGGGFGNNGGLHYANMHNPGGFTAVSHNTLVNSQSVWHNNIRVSPNQMSRLTPVHNVALRPTRTTMLGAQPGHVTAAPPPRSFNRPVMSRATAPINRGGFSHGGSTASIARPGSQMGNFRGSQMGSMRGSVPHPPSAAVNARGGFNGDARSNVARPVSPMNTRSMGSQMGPQMRPQSVPRPPEAGASRGGQMGAPRGGQASMPRGPQMSAPRGQGARPYQGGNAGGSRGPRSEVNVPRPPNSSAPQGYSAAAQRGGFSGGRSVPPPLPSYQANNRNWGGGNYGRSTPSYGGGSYSRSTPSYSGSYSRPAPSYNGSYGRSMPSYGGNYGRSMPSYGGGSYSRPSPSYGGSYGRSMPPSPSYGGGNYGRSVPSYSAPSHGGGSYAHSAPSYGGGAYGGGHSYGGSGGGGRSYGGGGGFGGGGHSGGGFSGSGGHSGGGGGHGGRH